ncbi:MAG: T9SS type A sorting domain-containing protein, partial [Bacteroidota bacterium]
FNTSTDATLSAPGAGESFHTLIINKPSAGSIGTNFIGYRVSLNSPALVSNILNLTSGYFITTPTNLMTIGAVGSVTGTGTDGTGGAIESFVDGPLRKTGTSNFVFPSGKIVVGSPYSEYHYRPIGISTLGSTSFDYTAEFIRGNPYTQGLISPAATAAGLQAISYCEYWNLTGTGGPTPITVTPSWSTHNVWSSQCNNTAYVINSTFLRVVPFNGPFPLTGASQWGNTDFGNTGTGIGNQSYIQNISWNGALNYNKFVLGTTNWQQAPLPFEMKYFKASGKENLVQLEWSLNFNQQVKSFVIERSRDGIRFETLKQVIARSNETNASYADADPAPYNGWGYYRLRITDISGQITYTSTQKVWFGKKGSFIQVIPNPAVNDVWISIAQPEKITELNLMNSIGQVLYKTNKLNSLNRSDVSSFAPGIYYLRMTGKDGVFVETVVKK